MATENPPNPTLPQFSVADTARNPANLAAFGGVLETATTTYKRQETPEEITHKIWLEKHKTVVGTIKDLATRLFGAVIIGIILYLSVSIITNTGASADLQKLAWGILALFAGIFGGYIAAKQ